MSVPKSHAQKCMDEQIEDKDSDIGPREELLELRYAIARDTAERERWHGPYSVIFTQDGKPNRASHIQPWPCEYRGEGCPERPCYIVECAEE